MSVRARMRRFEQALRERGLKSTAQRDDIARVFFGAEGHLSVEELYAAVRRVNPRVGYATVYRTLKLLKECGLAAERHFDDGQARYEPVEDDQQQHDHIICERCGKIVEFASQELERLQERIGRFLGFVVGRHRIELYGICAECREGRRRRCVGPRAAAGAPARGRPPRRRAPRARRATPARAPREAGSARRR